MRKRKNNRDCLDWVRKGWKFWKEIAMCSVQKCNSVKRAYRQEDKRRELYLQEDFEGAFDVRPHRTQSLQGESSEESGEEKKSLFSLK